MAADISFEMRLPVSSMRRTCPETGEARILWKIFNKRTINSRTGPLVYEVEWLNSKTKYLVDGVFLQKEWPDAVAAWEEKYGEQWTHRYMFTGNIHILKDDTVAAPAESARGSFQDIQEDSQHPESSALCVSGTQKRVFEDTPSKARRIADKKVNATIQRVHGDEENDSQPPFVRRPVSVGPGLETSRDDPFVDDLMDVDAPERQLLRDKVVMAPPPRPGTTPTYLANLGTSSQDEGESTLMVRDASEFIQACSRLALVENSQPDPAALQGDDGQHTQIQDILTDILEEDEELIRETQNDTALLSTLADNKNGNGSLSQHQLTQTHAAGISIFQQISSKLSKASDRSVYELLEAAMNITGLPCDRWVKRRKSGGISPATYREFLTELWQMLVSFDPIILTHLANGDLPKARKNISELREKLSRMANVAPHEYCPSIYGQYLVNKDGESPTVAEIEEILRKIELYILGFGNKDEQKSGEFAANVEVHFMFLKASAQKAAEGARMYIPVDKAARIEVIKAWIAHVRTRIENLPPDHRLERPLCEIGYAAKPIERLLQHKKHTDSNYIMNLTEAVCKEMWGDKYRIEQFVLFHLWKNTHAMSAEILVSRIAMAYITYGGGFCQYPAGESHGVADEPPVGYYGDMAHNLLDDPGFHERTEEEFAKLKKKAQNLRDLAQLNAEGKHLELQFDKLREKMDGLLIRGEQIKARELKFLEDTQPIVDLINLRKKL
jgi:hypothetical protein